MKEEKKQNKGTAKGGGIYNDSEAGMDFCTIADNKAVEEGGGIYIAEKCLTQLKNALISGNSAEIEGADVLGTVKSQGTILILLLNRIKNVQQFEISRGFSCTSMQLRPVCLAVYSALSASTSNAFGVFCCIGTVLATPMLNVTYELTSEDS